VQRAISATIFSANSNGCKTVVGVSSMGQSSSNRVVSRFTEANPPPNNVPLPNDYLNEPLDSLEESLKNMHSRLENLEKYISDAKRNCYYPNEHKLTRDEAAAIHIYTKEWSENMESLYTIFNRDLRTKDRSKIKPWLPFLRLFMAALAKIPSQKVHIYRGLRDDVSEDYTEGKNFVWASATSCTRDINVAHNFFSNSNGGGTLFRIDAYNGKDISAFSCYKLEAEVLLCPGAKLRVAQKPKLENIGGNSILVIQLQEV
jgi:hypothetical protein